MSFLPRQNSSIKLSDLLSITGSSLLNNSVDTNREILGVSSYDKAGSSDVTFLSNPKYFDKVASSKAGFCFIESRLVDKLGGRIVPLVNENPYLAFSKLVTYFYGSNEYNYKSSGANFYVSSSAKIAKNVKIGHNVYIDDDVEIEEGVTVMPNSFIGAGVKIGKNCFIYDNVSVYCAVIGENTIIRSGARVGNMGFGFVPDFKSQSHYKNQHICGVIIGKNVDIGSNTTIDRGFLNDTVIGDNTKIDNLVQIAHGVEIGQSCFIAAQVGISGSTKIGNFVFCGGQVGFAGHLNIASFSKFVAQSGVAQDISEEGETWAGSPSIKVRVYHKINALLKQVVKKNNNSANI